jgi:hypothetical protein
MSLVSKDWRGNYLQVPEQQLMSEHDVYTENVEITCGPRMTLLTAAAASVSVMKLACECGLPLDSSALQFAVGRWGDIATLSAAFKAGMPQREHICDGAARGGRIDEFIWLAVDQKCPVYNTVSVSIAASGSVPLLDLLKRCGIGFTVETACSAAAAGHQHIIEYLHAEDCVFDTSVYLAAAKLCRVHVLQRLRELECPWEGARVCKVAAASGHVHVLQWAKQHDAVFTEDTMVCAAAYGHTVVCEYLHAQQCPIGGVACTAAAHRGHVDTLKWLLEHGYPCIERLLWRVAAEQGHVAVLDYLQLIALPASPDDLSTALFKAGANSQLATAQWLRVYGVE